MAPAATNNKDVRVPDTGFGDRLDLVAPGATGNAQWGITTTDVVGKPGYNDSSPPMGGGCPISPDFENLAYTQCTGGTSAATAIVSGVAALVRTVNPSLTPQEVQNVLKFTADKVNCAPVDYDPPCSPPDSTSSNDQYGYGRVNAFAAVDSAADLPGASTDPSIVVQPATFEMGFRAGVTWLNTSAADRTVSNAPGGGPDGEPAMYVAWIPSGFPAHWMFEAQLGLSYTDLSNPQSNESNVVLAVQPAYLYYAAGGQLYAGINAAYQNIDTSGSSSSDTAWGAALGYRYRPIPQMALRAELRYRSWNTRNMDELGLGFALGVVF
jgi:opacity protein-like surface antigen